MNAKQEKDFTGGNREQRRNCRLHMSDGIESKNEIKGGKKSIWRIAADCSGFWRIAADFDLAGGS